MGKLLDAELGETADRILREWRSEHMAEDPMFPRHQGGGSRDINNELVADALQTSARFPCQYEGHLKDGRWFYYRYRHGTVWLGLGQTLDEAVDDSELTYKVMPGEETTEFRDDNERDVTFNELLQRRLAMKCSQCGKVRG